MSISVATTGPSLQARATQLWASFYAWASKRSLLQLAVMAALVMAFVDLNADPARLTTALGDTDDATRLTQVRQLMAGQAWFDQSMPRFGGPDPLISHWSRIIDLPLAVLMSVFSALFGPAQGELITRMLWPTLLSVAIIATVAGFCDRIGPRATAMLAVVLAAPAMGHYQFAPGRIDHHSGMIIGAVGGTFLLIGSIDMPRAGWAAGVLLGLGVAIGYEGLGLTAVTLAMVVVTAIWQGYQLAGIARAAVAFALTLLAAFIVFGPALPNGVVMCDVLSTNIIALAACGAGGVMLAHGARTLGQSRLASLVYVAVMGGVGIGLYLLTQPACLGGPLGQLDPALIPIWLTHVKEVQSVPELLMEKGLKGLPYIIYLPVALGYGLIVVRGRLFRHAGLYFAIFLVAALLGCWQMRLLPYASLLAVPLIAFGVHRPASSSQTPFAMPAFALPKFERWHLLAAGACAAAVVALFMVMLPRPEVPQSVASAIAARQAAPTETELNERERACTSRDSLAPLAALTPGLAANDIDIGPYVVAHTNLNVLAAPYHRMGRSILANHALLNASASEAKLRMQQAGARYIILCEGVGTTIPAAPVPGDALRTALLDGRVPEFLEPVIMGATPVKVWRLKEK